MGQSVWRQVGVLTGPFTKQVNCIAAAELPVISTLAPTPDEVDLERGAHLGLEHAGERTFEKYEKLRRWHKKYVPTRRAAKGLKWAGLTLQGIGLANAVNKGSKNFADCERGSVSQSVGPKE